jgi:hypothetical protein
MNWTESEKPISVTLPTQAPPGRLGWHEIFAIYLAVTPAVPNLDIQASSTHPGPTGTDTRLHTKFPFSILFWYLVAAFMTDTVRGVDHRSCNHGSLFPHLLPGMTDSRPTVVRKKLLVTLKKIPQLFVSHIAYRSWGGS